MSQRRQQQHFECLRTVNLDGRAAWFACPIEAQSAYLDDLNRQLRVLRGEHERVTALLRQLRGQRTYAELAANDNGSGE